MLTTTAVVCQRAITAAFQRQGPLTRRFAEAVQSFGGLELGPRKVKLAQTLLGSKQHIAGPEGGWVAEELCL